MRVGLFLAIILFGSTCFANSNQVLYGSPKVGSPYKIGKKIYHPKEYTSLQEEGYISWYGPGFHGKTTANGATFNKNTYTAAHKTLQMPSVAEITNLENGKKLIAVVNDRGPFSETQARILDVSEKIAKDLGFLNQGVTHARIKYLPKETKMLLEGKKVNLGPLGAKEIYDEPRKIIKHKTVKEESVAATTMVKNPSSAGHIFKTSYSFGYLKGIYVQVGAFGVRQNAENAMKVLEGQYLEPVKIRTERSKNGENVNIVRIGPIQEGVEENILTKVKNLGYSNARILIIE